MEDFTQKGKVDVTFKQSMDILLPYSWHQIREQINTVVPVCVYLIIFHLLILRYTLSQISWIASGIFTVIFGLVFFLEGVRFGLIPIGETIGDTLPKRCKMPSVLLFAFLLGILAAFGEPVIGSLQIAGAGVDPLKAPLLYRLLISDPMILTLTVSFGVGVAVVLGTLRFILNLSLKPFILPLIGLSLGSTLLASRNHNLSTAIGLAWDTGAVIVGPVLCPLVLSLGIGVCRATGRSDSGMSGFGMVALISILPITFVILVSSILSFFSFDGSASSVQSIHATAPSVGEIALESLILGIRAIAPIFIFLYLFMRFYLRESEIPFSQV